MFVILIEPEGIETWCRIPVVSEISILIEPEGIETIHRSSNNDTKHILIEPEGIETRVQIMLKRA